MVDYIKQLHGGYYAARTPRPAARYPQANEKKIKQAQTRAGFELAIIGLATGLPQITGIESGMIAGKPAA